MILGAGTPLFADFDSAPGRVRWPDQGRRGHRGHPPPLPGGQVDGHVRPSGRVLIHDHWTGSAHGGPTSMTQHVAGTARAPRAVTALGSVFKALLGVGVRLGFNGLITIRGRKSGDARGRRRWPSSRSPADAGSGALGARSTGSATCEPRASATITVRRRARPGPMPTELRPGERVAFFRDVLGPLARSMRGGRRFDPHRGRALTSGSCDGGGRTTRLPAQPGPLNRVLTPSRSLGYDRL